MMLPLPQLYTRPKTLTKIHYCDQRTVETCRFFHNEDVRDFEFFPAATNTDFSLLDEAVWN